jgi:cytochrome c peroxidase
LPKDIAREELIATMRGYTAGLGVQCNYCHVQEGRGGRNDFATDEKAPKKTARVMITMMNHVNETLATGLGKPAADITKVQCATCHRGEAIPKNPPPPPAAAPPAGQAAAPGL